MPTPTLDPSTSDSLASHKPARTRFIYTAMAFEAGLGLLAAVIGWLLDRWPWQSLLDQSTSEMARGCWWGILATVPMALALYSMDRWPVGPLAGTKRWVQQHVVPMFAKLSICELALLSIAAGVGEELLFRGLLQISVAGWVGAPHGWLVGLVVASIVFGICHWLTSLYALLATIVAIYLGGLFIITDNLLVPIVAHALYDFVALVYLVKNSRETRVQSRELEEA